MHLAESVAIYTMSIIKLSSHARIISRNLVTLYISEVVQRSHLLSFNTRYDCMFSEETPHSIVLLCHICPAAIWTVHSCWPNGSNTLLSRENLQQQFQMGLVMCLEQILVV